MSEILSSISNFALREPASSQRSTPERLGQFRYAVTRTVELSMSVITILSNFGRLPNVSGNPDLGTQVPKKAARGPRVSPAFFTVFGASAGSSFGADFVVGDVGRGTEGSLLSLMSVF